jgi:hypothetical protein
MQTVDILFTKKAQRSTCDIAQGLPDHVYFGSFKSDKTKLKATEMKTKY